MRVRHLLLAFASSAIAMGLLSVAAVIFAAHQEEAAAAVEARAQTASHEVSGLLVLTQEFARHAEERAAHQWHGRLRAINEALQAGTPAADLSSPALNELARVTGSLPDLFERLQRVPAPEDTFAMRRRDVLLDQLLTSTQAMSDYAYQWYQDAAAARRTAERHFQVAAVAAPMAMLLMVVSLAWLVRRRVLRPMDELSGAAIAISQGELLHRIGSQATDEFGQLSHRLDQMAVDLARHAEQTRRSEAQLRAITANLPALIAHIDSDERYSYVNAHFLSLLGVTPEQTLGHQVRDILGEANYAAVRPHLEVAMQGMPQHFERATVIHGQTRHLLTRYVPEKLDDGRVVGIFATAVDVSEMKAAEARLREGEQRLRDITNNIPAMVALFDREERCLFANDTALKMHSFEPADVPRHTLRSAIGEESYALHAPHIAAVLAGERRNFEGYKLREGRGTYYQAHLAPAHAADGSVQGFYLMTFDVTPVRMAELARRQSEERLRQITDNLPVLISYIDRDQRVLFANETYRHWFGVDPSAIIGQPVRDVIGDASFEPRRTHVERALAGERVEFEGLVEGQGVCRSTSTVYVPDIGADGGVKGIYTLSSDVSALKKIEQQLQLQARRDTLTGLPNRLHYNEKISEVLARSERTGEPVALMFMDIDRFKSINDTFGHAVGDAVLKEFARRLIDSLRVTDTVARLAGDEFVVILEGLHSAEEPQFVARKIMARMSRPFDTGRVALEVTSSIGIAFHAAEGAKTTPPRLLARADQALYAAKEAGRNTFRLAATPVPHE